jgi:hypothetical protein
VPRVLRKLIVAVALTAASVVIWLIWAYHEYAGDTGCPFTPAGRGHPFTLLVVLSAASAMIMLVAEIAQYKRGVGLLGAVLRGLGTGVGVAAVVYLAYFFFAAGLQCLG